MRDTPVINQRSAARIPLWAVLLAAFLPLFAGAQEQIRPSNVAGRLFRPVSLEQRAYNLKAGPVSVKFNSAMRFEFNDNITLSEHDRQSDLILTPSVSATLFWPITPYNALTLNGTIGYRFYLAHPELNNLSSGLTISPDTELSFDIYAGNFRINLHEQPSLLQDATGEPTLSNVPLFGRFINTAGVSVIWSANSALTLTASYDHTDFVSTSSQFDFADFHQDQLSFSSQYIFSNGYGGGFEGATAFTRYNNEFKQDATTGHFGIFGEGLLTPYTRVRLAAGYQTVQFEGDSSRRIELVNNFSNSGRDRNTAVVRTVDGNDPAADQGTYYLNFIVTNQLSRYYTQSLTVARENQLGITSQRVSLWSVRYHANWRLNSLVTLDGTLLFDDGTENGGGFSEHFERYGASLATSVALSRKLTLSLGYEFILKDSDLEDQSYSRNLVFGEFDYQF